MHLIRFVAVAFAVVVYATAAQANVFCKGTTRIEMSDGARACVIQKELTEITRSRSIVGGGPATVLKSEMSGAAVVVNFENESRATGLSSRVLRTRAREICARYAPEFIAQVKRPGNPFMVVIMSWGKKKGDVTTSDKGSYRQIYLTKNCWVSKGG